MEPFPVPSPLDEKRAYYAGLNMALEDLYGRDSNLAEEKEIFRYEIPLKDFLKAVKKVFKEKGYRPGMLAEPECRPLISDTHQVFRKAVENGVADNDIPDEMARRLDHDTFIFSGFKVHHELSEAGLSLRDENGKLKSYAAFEKDVTSIHEKYNRNYLRSEYNFAVASAQMAANWKEVEAGKNRYDLQYRTAGDYRVRRTHKALQDITLPADDPFWDKYYPPNGWSCRCTAVEVLKGKYPVSDSKDAIMKGEKATSSLDRFGNNKDAIFRFNPGKDGKIFPPKHPYLPKGCDKCQFKSEIRLATPVDPALPQCQACFSIAKICLAGQKKIIQEWRDKNIPLHGGIQVKGDNFKTGSLAITRGSIKETIGHTLNIDVRDSLIGIEENSLQYKYLGWAPCEKEKHAEAAFFLYYSVEINGNIYYANVKAHRVTKLETLYCIRDKCNLEKIRKDEPPSVENW